METCIRFYARVTGWGILDWEVSSCRAFAWGILRFVTLPAHAKSWSADNADIADFIFKGESSNSRHFVTYRHRIISGSFVQRPRSCLALFIVFFLRLIFPFFFSCSLRTGVVKEKTMLFLWKVKTWCRLQWYVREVLLMNPSRQRSLRSLLFCRECHCHSICAETQKVKFLNWSLGLSHCVCTLLVDFMEPHSLYRNWWGCSRPVNTLHLFSLTKNCHVHKIQPLATRSNRV
jgi:hypothetical protein